MYRTNAQSRALEERFVAERLPYRLVGGTRFYERREIKDLLAYLRLVLNPFDSISLDRVLNVPPRRIGDRTQKELRAWARVDGGAGRTRRCSCWRRAEDATAARQSANVRSDLLLGGAVEDRRQPRVRRSRAPSPTPARDVAARLPRRCSTTLIAEAPVLTVSQPADAWSSRRRATATT